MRKYIYFGVLLSIFFFNIDVKAEEITNPEMNEIVETQINEIEMEKKLEEKRFFSLSSTELIAVITAGVALFGSILSFIVARQSVKASNRSSDKSIEVSEKLGYLAAETQSKQRLIETISTQRVEWINNVRVNFSLLSKHLQNIATKRSNKVEIPDELVLDLVYSINHIELFLNPTETITRKFIEYKDIASKYLLNDMGSFSWVYYQKVMLDLHYIEQVILKSEWKRLKIETKSGSEVENMEKIHKVTAEMIDLERYNSILKNEYDH